ncbi:MAG: flagellar basal body rod protein FlgC [Candidatus Puniceispirillum sp. TMED52]|nr:flagellar basal body rod protein FlgC [SAR116 cluster bacterium]OUU46644.1 MAG: flagellar basal body rod protein FlgC [Candidatus Puniceispirillum sp. TMED52]HCP19111.1 flagellar basal body rod protein FlgC [Alphaproteobacteria bacterium]|tara:strand:- start:21 stop:437 length:417 start_codon:yes stop_codon:yes gene_type:complete
MADIKNVYDIAGRSMASQLIRMNTIASNIANAGTMTGNPKEAYKSIKPIFESTYADQFGQTGIASVTVTDVVEMDMSPSRIFMPFHPQADEEGYVYGAAVNIEEEYVEMMETSRQYQNNVEVITTMRALDMRTINMGK